MRDLSGARCEVHEPFGNSRASDLMHQGFAMRDFLQQPCQLASRDSSGSAPHHQNNAKAHFAAVHPFIGVGYAAKRKFLDHGMHVA
jgi:hypothetical protein